MIVRFAVWLILLLLRPMLLSPCVLADGFARRSVGDSPPGGAILSFRAMVIDLLVFILRFIFEVIFLELLSLVGRFVLRAAGLVMQIASFGGVRAASMDVPPHEFNWFYCRRSENGQIEVESTVAGEIGLVICFVCLALVLHFF